MQQNMQTNQDLNKAFTVTDVSTAIGLLILLINIMAYIESLFPRHCNMAYHKLTEAYGVPTPTQYFDSSFICVGLIGISIVLISFSSWMKEMWLKASKKKQKKIYWAAFALFTIFAICSFISVFFGKNQNEASWFAIGSMSLLVILSCLAFKLETGVRVLLCSASLAFIFILANTQYYLANQNTCSFVVHTQIENWETIPSSELQYTSGDHFTVKRQDGRTQSLPLSTIQSIEIKK